VSLDSGLLLSGSVDFVGEDVLGEGEADGQVEPGQQLGEGLAVATDEHGEAVVSVDGGGNAADWFKYADGDLTVGDQVGEVRQGRRVSWPIRSMASVAIGDWCASIRS
jgi:hypothetical protein